MVSANPPFYAVRLPVPSNPLPANAPPQQPPASWRMAALLQTLYPNSPPLPWNWLDLYAQRDPIFLLQFPMFDIESDE